MWDQTASQATGFVQDSDGEQSKTSGNFIECHILGISGGRDHARTETENGCVSSTAKPR
jgi:hypothetical protein